MQFFALVCLLGAAVAAATPLSAKDSYTCDYKKYRKTGCPKGQSCDVSCACGCLLSG